MSKTTSSVLSFICYLSMTAAAFLLVQYLFTLQNAAFDKSVEASLTALLIDQVGMTAVYLLFKKIFNRELFDSRLLDVLTFSSLFLMVASFLIFMF